MDVNRLSSAGIDYEDGVRRCAGDEGLYRELLELMLKDSNFALAQEALDDDDFDRFFSHMHELKGMSGTVSFTKVYALATQLVDLYRANDFDAIPEVFENFEEAYKVAIEAVQKELA